MTTRLLAAALAALALALAAPAAAQQKLGFVDTERVVRQLPSFRTAQAEVDRLGQRFQAELAEAQAEADELEREFAARELLYTEAEREQGLEQIQRRRQDAEALRTRYFGPEGELFRQQEALLRPAQEEVLAAIEAVASEGDYDFVFDRSGDYVFLYASDLYDLTERVLDELGVRPDQAGAR